jgi:acyl-homoserine-lactone acylase
MVEASPRLRARLGGSAALVLLGCLALIASLVAPAAAAPGKGLGGGPPASKGPLAAEIRYTEYGVPHVKARDHAGLGYGMGYATSRDTLCELFDRVLTVRGERSLHLGAGTNQSNVVSDAYQLELIETGAVEAILAGEDPRAKAPSAEARAMVRGYVAGVNRYLADTPQLPDPRCADAPWISELEELDYWRTMYTYAGQIQPAAFYAAEPPAAVQATRLPALEDEPDPETVGSNAYGFGSEATKNGRGALLGNPHYPWQGQNRFYRMHLTIPGKLNVVGAGLINTPVVGIGHNADVAWTHTVSTARRFGFFRLQLDPDDPTSYVVDGESRPMQATDVTVAVRQADGSIQDVTRTLYRTEFGRVIAGSSPPMPWTSTHAFTIRSTVESLGFIDQYLEMWQAADVGELFDALGEHQQTTFNTTAADSAGGTLFGDLGAIPNVSEAKVATCSVPGLGQVVWNTQRMPVLDASRSACEWDTDADSAVPGIFGPANSPHLFRDDYVTQSNDSHWLTNPEQPLEGYSRIFGDERTQRSLRTRLGLVQVEERLAGTDGLGDPGFDLETVQASLYGNRHLAGELARDDLLGMCRDADDATLGPVCDALAGWDGRVNVDSHGALLFRFWLSSNGLRFADAFDVNDPVHTPRQLDTGDGRVLDSLRTAANTLATRQLPLDAPLGEVQFVERQGERIPIHGGPDPGVFNIVAPIGLTTGQGFTDVTAGASWIMSVEFTDEGVRSEGVLTYSQSTNPTSPHFADQTRLYSEYGWDDLRLTERAVRQGLVESVSIRETPPPARHPTPPAHGRGR